MDSVLRFHGATESRGVGVAGSPFAGGVRLAHDQLSLAMRLALVALPALVSGGCTERGAEQAPAPGTTRPVPSAGSGYGLGGSPGAAGSTGTGGKTSGGAAGRGNAPSAEGGQGETESGEGGAAGAAAQPAAGEGGANAEGGAAGAAGNDGSGGNSTTPPTFEWPLPPGFPLPPLPEGKLMNSDCVELGRHLFYDPRLSGNQTQSCADCHHQELAFTDGRARALGSTGDEHPRAALSIVNVAYYTVLTWQNPLMLTLEQQAIVPMFGDNPVELGLTEIDDLLTRLRPVSEYAQLFPAAFPGKPDPFELSSVTDALACFERTIISGSAPYDDYIYGGKEDALSASAKRGLALFFSEKADCYHCHSGFNFSDNTRTASTTHPATAYHNTGLYNVDGQGAYPAPNTGKAATTGVARDMGAFRTPSLRNVELTAPYFHDGSAATIEEVLEIYNAGGRNLTSGENAGDGRQNPLKDSLIRPLGMSPAELTDLAEFLRSLTDRKLITDPRLSNPWE